MLGRKKSYRLFIITQRKSICSILLFGLIKIELATTCLISVDISIDDTCRINTISQK